MKVCVTFHNDIFTPWPATSIIHPVEVLLEAGHEVVVISWDKGRGEKLNEATLPVRRVRVELPVRNLLSLREFSRRLSSAIVEERPGLVLAFDLEVLSGSEMGANALGVPLLFFAREDWPSMVRGSGGLSSLLRSMAFSRMERRICKRSVAHAYSVNDERGAKYRGWSVPYTTIYTTRGLAELPAPGKKHSRFTVCIAGSMLEMQALPTVLDAMKEGDWDLRLVGGDEKNLPAIREMVESSGPEGRVSVTGRLPSAAEYYGEISRCHLGLTLPLNTDRNKYLGISVKMWDYMSMGLPQVVSNLPAMVSVMKGASNGPVGLASDPLSSSELAECINYYRQNPAEAQRAGTEARRLFEERYCWERQKEALKASHPVFSGAPEPDRTPSGP